MSTEDWTEYQQLVANGIPELRERLDAEHDAVTRTAAQTLASQLMATLPSLECLQNLTPGDAELFHDDEDGDWKGHITFGRLDGLDPVVTVTINVDSYLHATIELHPHCVQVA